MRISSDQGARRIFYNNHKNREEAMNDTSAILLQLLQSLGVPSEPNAEENQFEHSLMSLRPLLTPRQQKILDLMVKMQEVRALLDEINQ